MDTTQLIVHIDRLIREARPTQEIIGIYAEVCEFLRVYAGPKSEFLANLKALNPRSVNENYLAENVSAVLSAFRAHVDAGLQSQVSPERRAQLDVVSDFLEQAHQLLESKEIHPAAPAVIIGAALEEFLRTWVESEGLSIGPRKPGLDSYATLLRDSDLITKQDHKDITAWGGLRNHAAHGEWVEVSDKNRIALMLEGVNLFMRRYSL
ncbi:MAG TPA: hypothetical protein PKD12_12705 [Nitrospira sp.]|nr:hypothetical protein [Nitrospira sp.]